MRKFGELKGYQGDIKGKALVDFICWIMPMKEELLGVSSNFWSHDAGEISRHFSDEVRKAFNNAEKAFMPFWDAHRLLQDNLIHELELTDREKQLWEQIWEYKEIQEQNYTWENYVKQFSKYHDILKELTVEDNEFVKFWVEGYE